MLSTMNLIFGTVIITLSLVYVFPKSVDIWKDGRSLLSAYQKDCYFLLTDRQRSVPLGSASGYYTACLVEINVESAISISVYVRSHGQRTSLLRANVVLYDQHPGMLSSQPLAVWNSQDAPLVEKFNCSSLWLVVNSSVSAPEKIDLVLDYAADDVINANACADLPASGDRFGDLKYQSSNLGSKAQLVCDKGYILTNGSGRFECMVSKDQLVWLGDGSRCESVCKHPWPVQHGTYSLKLISNKDIDTTRNQATHSIVRYVCNSSYQLIGNPVSECTRNNDGVPAWSSVPPTCQPHVCGQTQLLTAEAGQIVSPKSPSGGLQGGSLNCTWKIVSSGHDVLINVLHLDLPLQVGVVLEISDHESHQMLRLTGRASAKQQSFWRDSFSVSVTYYGHKHDTPNHTGFVLGYKLVPRSLRPRRAAVPAETTPADPIAVENSLSRDVSSYQAVAGSGNTTTEQPTAGSREITKEQPTAGLRDITKEQPTANSSDIMPEQPRAGLRDILTEPPTAGLRDITTEQPTAGPGDIMTESGPTFQGAVTPIVISLTPSSSMDSTPLNVFVTSITDVADEQSTQIGVLPALTSSFSSVSTASDTPPHAPTTLDGRDGVVTFSGVVLSEQTTGVESPSLSWNATDTTSGLPYDTITASFPGDVSSSSIAFGTDDLTSSAVYGVTAKANPPADSNDGWKIALGIIIPLIGIGLILLVGYIVYRKKYPVRMIIGREFAKFSNPVYARSKHAPSLIRDDAEDYFSSRASSSVNLDEMNPVNQNIHYNAAFVSEEDEQDKRFIEQKAWLFAKTSNGNSASSRPMSEITLCSNDSTGAAARNDSTDSLEVEIDKLLGQQKQTPRIKPKRKKLQSRSSSSSVETLSETASASDSVDLPEGRMRSPDTVSEDQEMPTDTPLEESAVSSSLDSDLNKESTYMKLSKIILEQPSFEEVCAEARSRSRSLSIDRTLPERRMRSNSVDPFKSARRSSFGNEDLVAPESVRIIYDSILAKVISTEMLGHSNTSITSIISETSIIDESMLDGLPDVARDRCLSMTSQNSNRHLVTDLDDVSVGGISHRSDVNAEDAQRPVRDGNQLSEFPAEMEIAAVIPKNFENSEILLDKSNLQYDDVTNQGKERDGIMRIDGADHFVTKAGDYLPEGGLPLEQGSDLDEQYTALSLDLRDRNVQVGEESGKTRVVRFDSVQSSDDGQEQGFRSPSRTLSTTSRGSSLSVSSGHSVSTVTSSESEDNGSYSFNNDTPESSKQSSRDEAVSEEEPEDGSFASSPSDSPTPPPSLTDARSSIPLSLSNPAGASSSNLPSTEKSSEIPEMSSFISEVDLSESSSDASDIEKQGGIASSKTGIAQTRQLTRQVSVLSSGDDENGTTSMTVDDIALVLDEVSETDEHTHGSLRFDRQSVESLDSTKQTTLTLTDVIVEDDIEV